MKLIGLKRSANFVLLEQ